MTLAELNYNIYDKKLLIIICYKLKAIHKGCHGIHSHLSIYHRAMLTMLNSEYVEQCSQCSMASMLSNIYDARW